MRLIDADKLYDALEKYYKSSGAQSHVIARDCLDAVCNAPTVYAVPIKAISEWLAGYAAPPKYALYHFPESGHCLANTMAASWEHHIRTMMECGLLQEEQNGTDNP